MGVKQSQLRPAPSACETAQLSNNGKRSLPYVMLALLSLLWGTSFPLIKIATRGFDPYAFAFLRVTIGAIVLSLVAASSRLLPCSPRWP